jgi:hypothetical protein
LPIRFVARRDHWIFLIDVPPSSPRNSRVDGPPRQLKTRARETANPYAIRSDDNFHSGHRGNYWQLDCR